MNQLHKYHKTLELDKILIRLAEMTCCEEAAAMARGLEPETSLGRVRTELEKTDGAFILSSRYGTPSFAKLHNPEIDLKRCESGASLNNRELLNIAAIYRQCRLLLEWRERCENVSTMLDEYFDNLAENRYLENKINAAIISEEEIDDNASAELSNIRRKIRQNSTKARDSLDRIIKNNAKYLQDSIVTMRDGRYVVPVKAEHRGEVPGLVHDTSASGATLFVEPMSVVEANNEIRVLMSKEQDEIERILAELSAECADFAESIRNNFRLILLLNLYFAKANLGASMRAVKPFVTDDGYMNLKKARHPLIDKDKVVPIDIELGRGFTSLIITGPNTGGKTVSLKTLGLLTLMTMCGLLIPVADQSRISIFDKVLVDIGDEQSIEQSLSTFSAHMTNIISILEEADDRSLVLVDELGSGTDPVEGAALAISIIEEISSRGSRLAATTHYAELKAYALETKGVENACCEFDVATLQPTYRLLIGVPGRSNAFAISRRLGLEEHILDRAEGYISNENRRFEDVVDSLEQARQDYEKERAELEEKNREYERLNAQLNAKRKGLENAGEHEIEKAREKAKYIVDKVRAESDALLNELEELRKQKEKTDVVELARRARAQMNGKIGRLYDEANPVRERMGSNEAYKLPRPLRKGDEVLVYDLDKQAVVLEEPDKSGNVMVQMGIMKTRVKLKNLRLIEQKNPYKEKPKSSTTRTIKSNAERSAKSEIDLRGYTVEEALLDLDQFIDNCVLSNINQISIIHGKGTGVLRTAVQSHLKRHRSIKTYRLGTYGEGESGVTIAELK